MLLVRLTWTASLLPAVLVGEDGELAVLEHGGGAEGGGGGVLLILWCCGDEFCS